MALQSRPEPMNATSHHSKVDVSLTLSDPIFIAGSNIAGKMQVECRGDGELGLGIGLIMVELIAIQEITSTNHSASSTFIQSRRLFQGPGLPPSNAIQSDFLSSSEESPLPAHHYAARRGLTTFFFRFPLPPSSPTSISFGPAQIRYEIRASVSVSWRGEIRLVTDQRDINVVESYDSWTLSDRPQGVAIAEGGNIWAQAFVTNGPLIAGQVAGVQLQLRNHSLKWTSGIVLALTRELRLSSSPISMEALTDSVTEVEFKGHEYMIPPGIEGVADLVINIPRSCRGSRGGPRVNENGKMTNCLFEVLCSLRLQVDMPVGSEPIIIIIPVVIHHPLAFPEAPTSSYVFPATLPLPYASPHKHAYPLSPPPGASYVDPYLSPQQFSPPCASWLPPSLPEYYKPWTPAFSEQYHSQDLYSSYPYLQHYNPLPPRPASAEPQIPYHDTSLAPELPSTTHLQLPQTPVSYYARQTLQGSPQHYTDSEEGKGLRASRISHALHLSSRNRSVSPLSHRYPLPQPSAQQQSPRHPHPDAVQIPFLPNPHDPQDVLHSPRPIPSPKQSCLGPSPRSENVCALERMADDVGRQSGDLSADLPKSIENVTPNVGETLLSPLLPSGEQVRVRPHVEALFPHATVPDIFALKPELESALPHLPTPLAAITPVKFPHAPIALSGLSANFRKDIPQESGLHALERRLLSEVSTRRQDAKERRPNLRSVVQPIKIPPSGDPAGLNDSAISSLTLADRDAFLRGDEGERDQEQEQDRDSDERTQHRGARHSQSDDDREVRTQRGRGWAKSKHSDEDDERRAAQKRKKGKESDMRKLRSEVKGRIAAWLGGIDPTDPPLVDDSLSMLSPTTPRFAHIDENEPLAPLPSPHDILPILGNQELANISFSDAVLEPPNPRSSGFVTISTLKTGGTQRSPAPAPEDTRGRSGAKHNVITAESFAPGPILKQMSAGQSAIAAPAGFFPSAPPARLKSPEITSADPISPVLRHFLSSRQPNFIPQSLVPGVNHDIHSARKGRDGRVTRVASLWAAKLDSSVTQAKKHGPPPPAKKLFNYSGRSPIKSPLSVSETNGLADTSKQGRSRAKKATTVPAVVSSSHAVPMLSSTASLACAPPNPQAPTSRPLPPMISETITDIKNVVKTPILTPTRSPGNLGFGQARLKDLIKKYQG